MEIPVSILIESEPDTYGTANTPPSENFGNESLKLSFEVWNSFRHKHEKLTSRTAHFNWMLRADPAMEAHAEPFEQYVARYRHYFDNLLSKGDQLGLHFHPYRWAEEKHTWVAELDDRQWLSDQLRGLVERFKASFGFSPESIRFSDNAYISNWMLDLLEESGLKIDTSLHRYNPAVFIEIPVNGSVNSDTYLDIPDYPYQPDPEDITKEGCESRRSLVLFPTSVGSRLFPVPDPGVESGYRLERQYIALDMAYDDEAFRASLDERLSTLQQPHLMIVQNTNVLTDAKFTEFFYKNLETISNHPLASSFVFCTASELVQKVNTDTARQFQSYGPQYVHWLKSRANELNDKYHSLRFNYMLLENYKRKLEKAWAEKAREVEEVGAYLTSIENELSERKIVPGRSSKNTDGRG